MRKLAVCLSLLFAFALSALASQTTISDNLSTAIQPYVGGVVTNVKIAWPSFTAVDGTVVLAGSVDLPSTGGAFLYSLVPNAGVSPTVYYTFTFSVGSALYSASVVVPATGPDSFTQCTVIAPWYPGGGSPGTPNVVQTVAVNGSAQTQRPKLNFAAGTNITLAGSDNGTDTTTVTINSTGGGSGSNAISFNGIGISGTPTDGQAYVYSATSGTFNTIAIPYWKRITVTSSQLTGFNTPTGTVTLLARANRAKVCGVAMFITSGMTGGSISSLTATVGDSNGTPNLYTPTSVDVRDNGAQDFNVMGSATASSNVTATFTAVGGNLSALTAGSVDIDLCMANLP